MLELSANYDANSDFGPLLNELERAGIDSGRVAVLTREPLVREVPPGHRSRMSKLGVAGAIVGFVFAISLVAGTSLDYKLPTGGMPLVPVMTTGVIAYELTLLGAILTTVIVLLFEGGFGPGRRASLHPELEEGDAIVTVLCATRQECELVGRILAEATPPAVVRGHGH